MIFHSRRANVGIELFVIVIILFAFAMTVAAVYPTLSNLKTSFDANPDLAVEAKESYDDLYDKSAATYDGLFMIMFVLFWIGAIALAFFIDTHPIWFVFNIILLAITLVVGMTLSNSYSSVAASMGIASAVPMMTFVFNHIVGFILGMVTSILLALYAKTRM